MIPRERQLAAIRHELPDRIPVDAICIENAPEIADLLGIEETEVHDRLGIDGRIVAPGYLGELPTLPDGTVLGPFGGLELATYSTAIWHPFDSDTTLQEVERHAWPDPELCDYEGAARAASKLGERYAIRGPYWLPIFSQVCNLFGIEDAMVVMALNPAVFEAAMARVGDIVCDICERLLDACGDCMPILCMGDDFATQRGLMISPEHWRRFVKPHTARIFEMAKRKGRHVWYHSCGDITSVLPDLIDIGVDVWETVQLHTLPLSAEELKRECGSHITFFGAVNTQRLPFVSPEHVREEVIRCIEVLGKDGGYICGPDHHIKPDVSAAGTVALFDTATGFRRQGYTSSSMEQTDCRVKHQ